MSIKNIAGVAVAGCLVVHLAGCLIPRSASSE